MTYLSTAGCRSSQPEPEHEQPSLLAASSSLDSEDQPSAGDMLDSAAASAEDTESMPEATAAAAQHPAPPPQRIASHGRAGVKAAAPLSAEAAAAQPASTAAPSAGAADPTQPRRSSRAGHRKPAGQRADEQDAGTYAGRSRAPASGKAPKQAKPQPAARPLAPKPQPAARAQAPKPKPKPKKKPAVAAAKEAFDRLQSTAWPSQRESSPARPQLPGTLACAEGRAPSPTPSISASLSCGALSEPADSAQSVIDLAGDSELDEGTDEPHAYGLAGADSSGSPASFEDAASWQGGPQAGKARHLAVPAAAAAAEAQKPFRGRLSVLDSMWPEKDSAPVMVRPAAGKPSSPAAFDSQLCTQPNYLAERVMP